MSEQAQALDTTGGLADLASFLSDTPEEESSDELEAQNAEDETLEEDNSDEANDEQEESEEQSEEEPAPVEKITVKVKGENGEETLELTPDEIASSYLRQQDYTKKTQALAQRENEAVQLLAQKHEEIRNQYLSQAELTRSAIVQMAGLRSEAEMAQLANTDPAAWVAENQRQQSIANYLNQLDQQINGEKQQAQQLAAQREAQFKKQAYEQAWDQLSKDGIDKPKLAKIYGDVNKNYGFTPEELANVYDPRLVRALRDAAAYRELQAQKSVVAKKVQDAPRMPQKQIVNPAQQRKDAALENKFRTGRAKLNDLAAFLR